MKTEFEVKFYDLNFDDLPTAINRLGGKQTRPRTLMRRSTFDIPDSPRGTFIRVRDEGTRITLTYKELKSLDIGGMRELEIIVDNYDNAVSFLKAIGMKFASDEENYREVYEIDGAEIAIDEWPGLQKFIEIEGESEDAVRQVANKLNLPFEKALYGNVDEVYRQLRQIDISGRRKITFEDPPSK